MVVLALGIGLNAAAFGLLEYMVIDPFPFEGAVRLVDVVVGGGQRLALIGIFIGSALALIVFRVASGLFFGVSAWDPLTYVGVAAILLATATAASLSPALRAVKTDPVEVLRLE